MQTKHVRVRVDRQDGAFQNPVMRLTYQMTDSSGRRWESVDFCVCSELCSILSENEKAYRDMGYTFDTETHL